MDERMIEWLVALSRALFWAAAVVLALAVIGAITVATSDAGVPFLADLQRESRGIAAVAALGGGITAAGVLAALGGILRLLLDLRERAEGLAEIPGRARSLLGLPPRGGREDG